MPEERGYERRLAPQAGTPMPGASADSFGAGFGRQLEATTQQLHRQGLERYAIERRETADSERAAFMHAFALHQENMEGISQEARKAAGPGHAQRMGEAWDAAREGMLDGITEDSVRRWATEQFEGARTRFVTSESSYEEGRRVEKLVTDTQAARDISANRVRRLEKPDDYLHETELMHSYVAGLDLPDDVKGKLARESDQVYAVSFLKGQIDRDPNFAKGLITAGGFDDVLSPDQLDALQSGADVEIRRADVEARRVAAEQEGAAREKLQTLKEADSQGIALPDETYAAASKLAEQMGDTSLALEIDGLRANAGLAKVWEKATPVQREARRTELARKVKRTPGEDRELKWLGDHSGALDSKFESDPAGFAAESGSPMPPLTDPVGRAQWARERSEAYGRPVPPLTKVEANQLQANYSANRAGAVEVLGLLAKMPAQQAAAAARQIDPNSSSLPILVTLPEQYRTLALDGRDALKGRGAKAFKSDDPRQAARIKEYDGYFAEALRSAAPSTRTGYSAVAGQIFAGLVDRSGGEPTADAYFKALNMALGATGVGDKRKGGLGKWGDSWFLLPDGVDGGAFGRAVYRQAREGRFKPINPDGSAASLKGLHPVAIGPGQYEFRDQRGNPVKSSVDGKITKRNWVVTVSAR